MIQVACDGSSINNPGPAGWAWYIDEQNWQAGYVNHATNNAMELTAVIRFLEMLQKQNVQNETIEILCDSNQVVQAMNQWLHNWKKNNWKKSDKKPVLNKELYEQLDILTSELRKTNQIAYIWVKGHSNHYLNNQADHHAGIASHEAQKRLKADHKIGAEMVRGIGCGNQNNQEIS